MLKSKGNPWSTYSRNLHRIFSVGGMNVSLAIQILTKHYGISTRTAKKHVYRHLFKKSHV